MTANHIGLSAVIHPVVVVQINDYKFRALLDSGTSHSYASPTAINLTHAKLKSTGLRQIAMLTGVTTRTMQVYEVKIQSLSGDFDLDVNITKIEKKELLSLDNPQFIEVLSKYSHLRGVEMDDDDQKDLLAMDYGQLGPLANSTHFSSHVEETEIPLFSLCTYAQHHPFCKLCQAQSLVPFARQLASNETNTLEDGH